MIILHTYLTVLSILLTHHLSDLILESKDFYASGAFDNGFNFKAS